MILRRTAHRSAATLALTLVGLTVAACSSSSHPSAAATGASTTTTATATGTAPSGADSSTSTPSTGAAPTGASTAPSTPRLAGITIQRSELPAAWQASPHVPDPRDAANQAALVTCVGGTDTAAHETGDAHSPDYKLGTSTISSEADSFRSQADVDADVAILHSPKIDACYSSLLRVELQSSLQKGETIKTATIKITPGSGGGPSNIVATGTGLVTVVVTTASGTPVTAATKTINIYAGVTFITGPLTEAAIDTTGIGQPVPASTTTALITAVAHRAAKS